MFLVAGGKWKHIGLIIAIALVGVIFLAWTRPYVLDRFTTFLDPERDPQGSSYQIQQSLIAIGSGGVTGRGFGQSIQKFKYLPEPIGDSIFAVLGEEFGFIGTIIIVSMFVFFGLRGFFLGARAPDYFGRLVITGVIVTIVSQSFLNISAMLGLLPLTGIPLLFISHGGTALMFALVEVGLVLNISRYTIRH